MRRGFMPDIAPVGRPLLGRYLRMRICFVASNFSLLKVKLWPEIAPVGRLGVGFMDEHAEVCRGFMRVMGL